MEGQLRSKRTFLGLPAFRLALVLAILSSLASLTAIKTALPIPNSSGTLAAPGTAAASQPSAGLPSGPIGIEGWVTGAAGGGPVAGAVVTINGQADTRADATGYFAFDVEQVRAATQVTAGKPSNIDVTVQAEGHASWTLKAARYYSGDTLRLYPKLARAGERATYAIAAGARFGPGFLSGAIAHLSSARRAEPAAMTSALEAGPLSTTPQLPTQIRVYRTATSAVEVVSFKDYVKHVLPNEWIPTWGQASLRAGAMAVKEYAWFWVSRGGKQGALGADVKDNTEDQVYDPNVSYASSDAAVEATWQYAMTRYGALFQAQYCAGAYNADPTGDCPWAGAYMTQWGASYYADQGKSWGWILQFYYPDVVVSPNPPAGNNDGPVPPRPSNPAPTRSAIPTSPVAPAVPTAPVSFTVGQGATRPDVFQDAYTRYGGQAVLGKPTGPAQWWLPYVSENNVIAQPFAGPLGKGNVWLVFDTLKSNVTGVARAYLLSGDIASAYTTHIPAGPEWVGAPTSDPYTAAASGALSQGFTKGTLANNGQLVRFAPWPQQFNGWKAEYFYGKPPLLSQLGPAFDLPGQPALVLDQPAPDMNWPVDTGVPKSMGLGANGWSAQFTRQAQPEAGSYDVIVSADSGVRLWIDQLLAVNAWNATAYHTEKYNVDMDGSAHTIRIQYFSANSAARLEFALAKRGAPTVPPAAPTTAPQAPPQPPAASQTPSAPIPTSTPNSNPSGNASLRVQVRWLGRAASPNDSWVQSLTMMLSAPGNPAILGTYKGMTDRNGVAIFGNLPTGVYDVHVKGSHALQSAKANVSLAASRTADVDMKAQIEGDVDGDNCVTIDDFALVQSMLGTNKDTPGYNPAADLNGDGQVTVTDVSLLRSGFDRCGDISADTQLYALSADGSATQALALAPWLNPEAMQHNLALSLLPSARSVKAGGMMEIAVMADAGNQPIDGASFILKYDPVKLTPVDANGLPAETSEPGVALPAVFGNWMDLHSGAVGFSAGMLQGIPPQGSIVLAIVRFRTLQSGSTDLRFAPMPSGFMQITNGGANLLAKASDLTLSVTP